MARCSAKQSSRQGLIRTAEDASQASNPHSLNGQESQKNADAEISHNNEPSYVNRKLRVPTTPPIVAASGLANAPWQ